MMTISGISSVFLSVLEGNLNYSYSLFGALVSLLGSFLGSYYILEIIRKRNKMSLILIALTFTTLFATILILYNGIQDFKSELKNN